MIGHLDTAQIDEVLYENVLGRIGCSNDKKVYVVPTNYVFDGRSIIAHAMPGEKIEMMRRNPDICFEVDQVQDITHWKSVITWGTYQELKDERERYAAMKLFTEKMIRLKLAVPLHGMDLGKERKFTDSTRSIVYRIVINEKTGRFENG